MLIKEQKLTPHNKSIIIFVVKNVDKNILNKYNKFHGCIYKTLIQHFCMHE